MPPKKKVAPPKKKATPKKKTVEETVEETEVIPSASQEIVSAVNEANKAFEMSPLIPTEGMDKELIQGIKDNLWNAEEKHYDFTAEDEKLFTVETWLIFKNNSLLDHLKKPDAKKKTSPKTGTKKTVPGNPVYSRADAFGDAVGSDCKTTMEELIKKVDENYMDKSGRSSNVKESTWIVKLGLKILSSLELAQVEENEITFSLPTK